MLRTALEEDTTATAKTLYLALELSQKTWKLALSVGDRKVRTTGAGDRGVANCRWLAGKSRRTAEHRLERPEESVDLELGERRRQGDAQPARAGRDRGRPDCTNEVAAVAQGRGRRQRTLFASEDDREDGGDDARDVEAEPRQPRPHSVAERVQPRAALRLAADDPERGQRGAARRGREGGREDEGPRAREEQVAQPALAGGVGAEAAERLPQRPHLDVDPVLHPELLGEAGSRRAEDAHRVRLVHVEHGGVALAQAGDLAERGRVAVHREDGGGDDELPARPRLRQQLGELLHVAVAVADELGAGEQRPVHDRRVVERIGEDGVAPPDQRGRQAGVGVVAGVEEERALGAVERGERPLQRPVERQVSRDEARRAAPRPLPERGLRGGPPEPLVEGQAEVVVGAEVDERAAPYLDHGQLRGTDRLER